MPWAEPTAVQFRVTLLNIKPEIWRQLVVPRHFYLGHFPSRDPGSLRLGDCHLHEFMIGGPRYGDPEQLGEPDHEDDPRASAAEHDVEGDAGSLSIERTD
jgi:hypothetical protein